MADVKSMLPPIFEIDKKIKVSGVPNVSDGVVVTVRDVRGPWVKLEDYWINTNVVPASYSDSNLTKYND